MKFKSNDEYAFLKTSSRSIMDSVNIFDDEVIENITEISPPQVKTTIDQNESVYSDIIEEISLRVISKIRLGNENYLKMASESMIASTFSDVTPYITESLYESNAPDSLRHLVEDTVRHHIEAGALTRPFSYPDREEEGDIEFVNGGDFTEDHFTQELGNSMANPDFKRKVDPRSKLNQLERMLMENSDLDEAFHNLGIRI